MTGFGRVVEDKQDRSFEVDIRAVNNKSLKLNVRLSEPLSSLVSACERVLKSQLRRGSISLQVRATIQAQDASVEINSALLKTLHAELLGLAQELGQEAPKLSDLLRIPGVICDKQPEADNDALWAELEALLLKAIAKLNEMREQEGQGIQAALEGHLSAMERRLELAEALVPANLLAYQERLKTRVAGLLKGSELEPDPKELAQQLAFFAERSDISEEIQRLKSHIQAMRETFSETQAVGRKLEFLAQEMHREANTIVSKTHGLDIVKHLLETKLQVDRIREQVANVE